jgi:hypothetical protein
MPFIYWGFFFKALDMEAQENEQKELARFRKEEEINCEDAVSVERITVKG